MYTEDLFSEFEEQLAQHLNALPFPISVDSQKYSTEDADIELEIHINSRSIPVLTDIKPKITPSIAQHSIWRIGNVIRKRSPSVTQGMLVAPSLSEQVRKLCREEKINYMDFRGNFYFTFENIFIQKDSASKLSGGKANYNSSFSASATRVLRTLLAEPDKEWKGVELAEKTNLTTSAVSKVRSSFADQNWIDPYGRFIRLLRTGDVIAEWKKNDKISKRVQQREYSLLENNPDFIADKLMQISGEQQIECVFTQWFAAQLQGIYSGSPVVSAYVHSFPDEDFLMNSLGARRVESGGSLILYKPKDPGVFIGKQQNGHFPVVSDLQLYMDLSQSGMRGTDLANELAAGSKQLSRVINEVS